MPQWQKPENALRRANELLEVGKKQDALDTLHDVIKARKHRTWTKVHEQIMAKHLELCVELRKPHLAKDGLFQYRNMCQQVNVKSLEDVVTAFLDHAERKSDQARQASQGLVEDVAEDLDQAESPERLLLSAVSGEGAQDRADRAVLSPWLRFLWESYRQCLELLRNNVQVEQLYHKVAKQAFYFCLKYQRRAEFRKLCDNLRTHVNQLQKVHTHYAVKLTNPDTLAYHQETRLTQLDVAIKMELWQEAYKSAEDVHQLMQSAKRSAKAHTLATYYERLALIFWKAGNTLYHTAALFKLFQLHKDLKKSFSSEEATHLATRVLLATLSIRSSDQVHDLSRHLEMEDAQLEHQRRLASLLSWPTPPTRQFLLKELQRVNVISLALAPAQQLYQWLECEFSPLKLAPEIQRLLNSVKECGANDYSQYIDALQQVAALKILKQVSQIYRSISLQRFLSIVPFFDLFQLERLIAAAGKKAQMQVRIDHRSGSVEFGVGEGLTFGSNEDESSGLTSAQLDVPVIQSMPSEHIRQYLQEMYTVLQDAVGSVDHELKQTVLDNLKNNAKIYDYHKNAHHTLERKKRIEAYKEAQEKKKTEQEELTRMQEKLELEKRQREDQLRLAQEKQERTEAQRRREMEEKARLVLQDRMVKMKGLRNFIQDLPEEEIQKLDADTLLQKQISHMEKEKREQQAKLNQQQKKWDHYVRAIHMEEIPLRETEYKEMAVKERQQWEEHETERVQREEEEHIATLSNHKRLARLEKDAREYLETIRKSREAEMKQRMEQWERNLQETRQRRLQERRDERKEKRHQEWLQAKEEAERQKKEDEERKKKETEEQVRRASSAAGDDSRQQKGYDRGGRRVQFRGDEDGTPHGSDAEVWARQGPLQPEPTPGRKPVVEDDGGRTRRAPFRAEPEEAGMPPRGADANVWARQGPLAPEPTSGRKAAFDEDSGRDRKPAFDEDRPPMRRPPFRGEPQDGGMPSRGADADVWARQGPLPSEAAYGPKPSFEDDGGRTRRGPYRAGYGGGGGGSGGSYGGRRPMGGDQRRGADSGQWRTGESQGADSGQWRK